MTIHRPAWRTAIWRRMRLLSRPPIWIRLSAALAMIVVLLGGALGSYAVRTQRAVALSQAQDFAVSVHQLTLAGLTGMMLVGQAHNRAVFLDQIERANHMRSLRVVRGPEVVKQYGEGVAAEQPTDSLEIAVLATGKPRFVSVGGDDPILRAVLPAIALPDYLGKNCLSCHQVDSGAVLGAVSMEISLGDQQLATGLLLRRILVLGFVTVVLLLAATHFLVRHLVAEPLGRLTHGLREIGGGHAALRLRLPVDRSDEIGESSRAFNDALDTAHDLVESQMISAEVFAHCPDGIVVTDPDGVIQTVNPAFSRLTGYSASEAIGQTPRILRSGRQSPEFYAEFWRALIEEGKWSGEIWNRRRNGDIFPEWLDIAAVRDETGEIRRYVSIFSDITERKHAEAEIHHRAHHDLLTGLPNRGYFIRRLDIALAESRAINRKLVVLFGDLDGFKVINDRYGHAVGDEILRQVADRLRSSVRQNDLVARLGGDEFTMLITHLSDERKVSAIMANIEVVMRFPFRVNAVEHHIGISLGHAIFPDEGIDVNSLLARADAAMYLAKGARRTERLTPPRSSRESDVYPLVIP